MNYTLITCSSGSIDYELSKIFTWQIMELQQITKELSKSPVFLFYPE